jgi:hypothetical protein
MTKKTQSKARPQIFEENPYDIETIFESLSIASVNDKELLYIDKLITAIRQTPDCDLTNINYKILEDLKILNLNNDNIMHKEI